MLVVSYSSNTSCISLLRSSKFSFSFGSRAYWLNSFTIVFNAATWFTIVSVDFLRISESCGSSFLDNLCCTRSALSCIGVRGFLISWARRLATSPHAAVRCAWSKLVISSKTTTPPPPETCGRRVPRKRRTWLMPSMLRSIWHCHSPVLPDWNPSRIPFSRARSGGFWLAHSSIVNPSRSAKGIFKIYSALRFVVRIRKLSSNTRTPDERLARIFSK